MIGSVSGLKVMEGAYATAASVTRCPCSYRLWREETNIVRSHYGPGIFDFFLQQNQKIEDGTNKEKDAHYIHLDTLGIVNGLIDLVVQGESLITYPYNNVSPSLLKILINSAPWLILLLNPNRVMGYKSSISLYTMTCFTTGHDLMAVKHKLQRARTRWSNVAYYSLIK